VAIAQGRIARISGTITGRGRRELDASGCIVAPGAVDLHTHYDAQLNWDPYCTLSGWHGVTTLTIGQCGFGFAPCRPEDRDLNMRMMNRIEAIPYDSMVKGMRWDWVTFPEYLASLERQGLGVNVASLFPYSPLRAWVLGARAARERTSVSDAELAQLRALFREGMAAGAFGFSADRNLIDRPEDGSFLPTQVASREEFLALAEVLREFGVGHIGWTIPAEGLDGVRDPLANALMAASGRPLHWGAVVNIESYPGIWQAQLEWLEDMHRQGLPMYGQVVCMGVDTRFTLAEYNLFDDMPAWVQPLVGTAAERAAKLRRPEMRAAMKRDLDDCLTTGFHKNWEKVKVLATAETRNARFDGWSVARLAAEQRKHPLDAFLDLALDEELRTEFALADFFSGDEEVLAKLIAHPYTHISVSDGGAHTRFAVIATWPTHFLAHWVRDKGLMSLEDAHYKISALPAWIAGFRDRGLLREGFAADAIVYEPERLGFVHAEPVFADDFPGGERRIIQKARGYRWTIVNGTVTFEDGRCTGALPGKLLRSGA
jgi:N-acyl-D-amino-acid deacylase